HHFPFPHSGEAGAEGIIRARRPGRKRHDTSWSRAGQAEGGTPMPLLTGTVKNGQIILDEAADLPEGTRVEVLPVQAARPALGMREEDWPTTPEGVAALLARMDQVEPGWLSPDDEAAWKA